MQTLAAMKPAHLRLPGGTILRNTIAETIEWTNTIGPIENNARTSGPWA